MLPSLFKKSALASVGTAALLAMAPQAIAQATDQYPVLDRRGNEVVDRRENCVRSRWDVGMDACAEEEIVQPAPAPMPVAAPAPAPVPALMNDETIVYFNFDKSNLTAEATRKLDRVASVLKSAGTVEGAKVVGYADPIGSQEYNVKLSTKRAKAVQSYLESQGVWNSSVGNVEALGETDAFARCEGLKGNQLIECFWKNRRVQVQIDYKQ